MALDIDFEDVDYISSAGLRVLMKVQKIYEEKGGSVKIVGAKDEIIEIFEVTGFTDFLDIEGLQG
jgi:anti-sigma B factor antagonist